METSLTITSELRDGCVVLALAGEIDATNSERLRATVTEGISGGRTWIILDLHALDFIDSSGLAALIHINKQAARHGGWVRLTGSHGTVHRLLVMTGLTRTISMHPTVAEALAESG